MSSGSMRGTSEKGSETISNVEKDGFGGRGPKRDAGGRGEGGF